MFGQVGPTPPSYVFHRNLSCEPSPEQRERRGTQTVGPGVRERSPTNRVDCRSVPSPLPNVEKPNMEPYVSVSILWRVENCPKVS